MPARANIYGIVTWAKHPHLFLYELSLDRLVYQKEILCQISCVYAICQDFPFTNSARRKLASEELTCGQLMLDLAIVI